MAIHGRRVSVVSVSVVVVVASGGVGDERDERGGRARARSEPFCRFGGLAVGIKGDLGGWAVQGFFFVFLFI